MFETLGGPEAMIKECRPDPEEMLKGVSDRIAVIDKGEALLEEFAKLPLYIHNPDWDKTFLMIFGHLKIKRMEAESEKERWLKEIDKDQT